MDKVDERFGRKLLGGIAKSPREIIVESPEITLGVRDAKQIERQIELLSPNLTPEVDAEDVDPQQGHFESNEPEQKKCPTCDSALELIGSAPRPRWSELFYGEQQPRWWRIYAGSS